MDVKYDASSDQFVMVEILNQFAGTSLIYQTSADGIIWDALVALQAAGQFPAGANNPGISGDESGDAIELAARWWRMALHIRHRR
jgi:hypothetical protein